MRGSSRAARACAFRVSLAVLAGALAAPALAQTLQTPASPPPAAGTSPLPPAADEQATFAADALDYDDKTDVVTAGGDVRMLRAGTRLRADKVVWNRKTGEVRATGDVAVTNPGGDTVYGDDMRLDQDIKDGVVDNMLVVLADGGRLAARRGTRDGAITTLEHAAYTPCRVGEIDGCRPHEPSWKITALRIIYDRNKHRISYRDARFHLFGHPILWLPAFSHPDGTGTAVTTVNGAATNATTYAAVNGDSSGLLLPNIQYARTTGLEYDQPYYFQLGPNRDFVLTPHLYTALLPAFEGQYRSLTAHGAYQVRAMATYGSRLPATTDTVGLAENSGFRGFVDANGQFQYGPYWTLSGQIRAETDRTFMKRYDISNDDRLRSALQAERIDTNSYLSIAGWYTQTLRLGDPQGQQPIALPAIDYRRRLTDPLLGGTVQLQLNSLALTRPAGQDTQRAFAAAEWDLRRLTPLGQEVTFTAYTRADLYHTSNADETAIAVYRGLDGWHGRGIAAAAVDMRWPFIGELFGGTQQIVPRVQFVLTPRTRNLVIPNEDSRSLDLDDSNLFALNRFSGYDRWEDGSRVTYGAEWNYQRPRLDVRAVVGQSYRLTSEPTLLPQGTGLTDRFSDYVGRVTVKYSTWLELTERFRIDKSNYAIRRSETDITLGGRKTYLLLGYLRLNRNIDTLIEDLRNREELRVGGRIQLARYWSIFGSAVVDLTDRKDDPLATGDGFQPVRERAGITYEDECLSLGISWRRDFDPIGDARRGSTVSLRLALKNVGR